MAEKQRWLLAPLNRKSYPRSHRNIPKQSHALQYKGPLRRVRPAQQNPALRPKRPSHESSPGTAAVIAAAAGRGLQAAALATELLPPEQLLSRCRLLRSDLRNVLLAGGVVLLFAHSLLGLQSGWEVEGAERQERVGALVRRKEQAGPGVTSARPGRPAAHPLPLPDPLQTPAHLSMTHHKHYTDLATRPTTHQNCPPTHPPTSPHTPAAPQIACGSPQCGG